MRPPSPTERAAAMTNARTIHNYKKYHPDMQKYKVRFPHSRIIPKQKNGKPTQVNIWRVKGDDNVYHEN